MAGKKTFYNNTDVDAIRKIISDERTVSIAEGKVLSVFADGTAKVQLAGSSTTIPAETTKNATVLPGDFVFLIRSTLTSRWFILTSASIQNITGVLGGASGGSVSGSASAVTAPNSLVVTPDILSFVIQWTPSGVQGDVVYQLEIADDTAETGSSLILVPGGIYIYELGSVATKYFRVRAIDKDWNTSGWTAWVNTTSLASISSGYYQTIQVDGSVQTQRGSIDFITGTGVTLTPVDDAGGDRTKITIDATASNSVIPIQRGFMGI